MKKELLLSLGITMMLLLSPRALEAQRVYMTDGFENGFNPTCDDSCKTKVWTLEYYDVSKGVWVSTAPQFSQPWKTETTGLQYPDGAAVGKGRAYFRNEPDKNGNVQTAGYRTRLITPVMDLSKGYQPILRFYHAQAKYTGDFDTLRVYYRTGEGLQWNLISEYTSPIKNWKFEEIGLPAVGEYYQIAFEASENIGRGIVLDSVLVRTRPQITTPHDITFFDMRDNGITVQWQASMDADYFQVAMFRKSDLDLNVTPEAIGTNVVLLDSLVDSEWTKLRVENLEPGATYYVQVRSIGETENSVWSDVHSIRMKVSVQVPFHETFDSIAEVSNKLSGCQLTKWTWGGDYQPHIPMYLSESLNELFSPNKTRAVAFVKFGTYNPSEGFTDAKTYIPAGGTSLLVSPEIASTKEDFKLNQCHVTFWGTLAQATDANARSIIVGIMTDNEDITTFVSIDTCTIWGYKTFHFFDINLADYKGDGRYVAFMSHFDATNQFYIDEFTIEERPAVGRVQMSSIRVLPDTASAALTWDAVPGATKYTVKMLKLENKGVETPIYAKDFTGMTFTATTNALTLTELLPASKYVIAIQAERGEWSQPRAFFTSAKMTVSDDQEAYYSFEADEGSYTMGTDLKTEYPADFMIFSNDPDYPSINTSNFRNGKCCLGMTKNVGCDVWVVAPKVADGSLSTLEVQFYAKTTSAGTLQLGVMTYPDDISTFVPVEEYTQESVYKKHYANFLSYKGNGQYIALRWVEVGNGIKSCNFIDDLTIRRLGSCLPVTGLTVLPTDSSAAITWNKASSSKWELKVNTSPMSDQAVLKDTGNVVKGIELDTNFYDLRKLGWAHTYYVYVRAKCDETTFGDWVGKSFTTDCPEKAPLPFKDDFERYDAATTKIPFCWNAAYTSTTTTYPKVYVSSANSQSGEQCIDLYSTATYGSYLALPEMDIDLKDAQVRFYAKGNNASAVVFVGVMTDPNDGDTFTRIDSIPMTTTPTQYSVLLSKYTGTGKYIAFSSWRGSANQIYLDDVEVLDVINGAPFNFSVKENGANSLTAQWDGKTTGQWQVIVTDQYYPLVDPKTKNPLNPDTYIPDSMRIATGTVANALFVIEDGLEPMTNYYFYVKSTNGTEWGVGTLMTACQGVNPRVRKTEGFEIGKTVTSTLASNASYANDYNKAQVPLCWTVGNAKYGTDLSKATTGSIRGYFPFIVSNGTIPTSGTSAGAETNYYDKGTALTSYAYAADGYNCLKIYGSYSKTASSNYAPAWAAMPYLECEDEDLPMMIISGQVQMSSSYALIVGVMEDPEDLSSFVEIDSIVGGKGTGNGATKAVAFEVSLEDYKGKGHYIAFRTQYGKTATVYLDEVNVSMAECAAPNISFSQLTDTTARLMSGLRIDNAWTYYLGFKPFDTKNMDKGIMPADTTYIETKTVGDGSQLVPYALLRGLLPDTTYYVAVATVCDGTTSSWRQESFRTLCPDIYVDDFSEDFEDYETTAGSPVGCWTVGNTTANASTTYIPFAINTTFPNHEKTKMLKFQANKSSGNGCYAVLPGISFPQGKSIRDYQLEMTVAMTGIPGNLKYTANEEGTLIVGITTDPSNLINMQVIDTFRYTSPVITKLAVPFDEYMGSGKFVVLLAQAIDKATSWFYVDDVKLAPIPSCKPAKSLQIDSVGQTMVQLRWEGEAAQYNVALSSEFYADSVKSDTLTAANTKVMIQRVTGDSVTIEGLKPNTNYYVYVQAVCSESDKSIWSYETPIFRTECPALAAIPWFDDFDDVMYATGNGNFGYCYRGEYIMNDTTKSNAYPQINSGTSFASSGAQSMKLYGTAKNTTVLTTPELDVNSLSELQLSFYAKGTAKKVLYIGTVDDADTLRNTFVPFDSVDLTASMVKYAINLDTVTLGDRAGKKHISFFTNGASGTVYIDDLLIRYIPTCYEPEDAVISNIGLNKATLTFAPAKEGGNKWEMLFKNMDNGTEETISLTQTTYQFTNLQPKTNYSVQLRTDCGEDKSEWAKKVTFHTKWIIDTYKFTFLKDEQGTISDNTPLSTSSYIHPALTSVSGVGNTSAYYPQYLANSTSYAYALDPEGNTTKNALKFQNSATYDSAAVILPIITDPKTKQLRFHLRAGYAYASDYSTKANRCVVNTIYPKAVLTIGTIDSAGTIESFRAFTRIKPSKLIKGDTLRKASNYGWDEIVLTLAAMPIEGKQVAFLMEGCGSATLYMGSLAIEKAENFMTPVIAEVIPADTTATINWLGNPAATYNILVLDTTAATKDLNYIPFLKDAEDTGQPHQKLAFFMICNR